MDKKYENKKIIAFDLDDTLTESRTPMDEEMIGLFLQLVSKFKVGVISGGVFGQFEKQLINPLKMHSDQDLSNLVILPANGTSFYIFKEGNWQLVFEKNFTEEEKKVITKACLETINETDYEELFEEKHGKIDYKGGQVSLAMFEPDWILAEKKAWDPERTKREPLRKILQEKLPNYEIKIGGTTTIDITPKGVDKALAMREILEYFHLPKESALFIGDAIFPGGNDYAAAQVVESESVSGYEDTKKIIRSLL